MAMETRCQTPDSIFTTAILRRTVMVHVELPFELKLSGEDEDLLKLNLHNAVELVLAPYFRAKKGRRRRR